MLRGNATERVATSCIKATAVIFTALEHSIKLYCTLQEFLLEIQKNLKTLVLRFFEPPLFPFYRRVLAKVF